MPVTEAQRAPQAFIVNTSHDGDKMRECKKHGMTLHRRRPQKHRLKSQTGEDAKKKYFTWRCITCERETARDGPDTAAVERRRAIEEHQARTQADDWWGN